MDAQYDMTEEDIIRALRARMMRNAASAPPGPNGPTNVPRGLFDAAAGALRGATAATVGAPGDIESILRGLHGGASSAPGQLGGSLEGFLQGMAGPTVLPKSEDVLRRLPSAGDGAAIRNGEAVGAFLPLPVPVRKPIQGLRALLKKRMLESAGRQTAEAIPFAEGGWVGDPDTDDALDQAYMNVKFD